MSDVTFANAWVLALLLVVPVGFAAWLWGVRRGEQRARTVSRVRGASPPYLAAALFSLAAMAAIGAAAQPRWGTRESRVPRTGADLVVVMDISRSMDARDIAPSRLQAAKDTVTATLARLGGDRVGLVVFAGSARTRFPLTTDFAAANQVIDSLATGVVFVEGGSAAGLGLEEAVNLLSDQSSSGRVILLLTDGDDLGGDPAASALLVAESGADLLVAGIATAEGATIPVIDFRTRTEQPLLDESGAPVVTRLNEPFLRALAAAAGGRYLGSDLTVVPGVVDGRLQALERAQIDARPTTIPIERYRYFAGSALALLVLGALAERIGRGGWRRGAGLAAAMFLLSGCATTAYEANEAGREALKQGDASVAIDRFLEVQVERPDDPDVAINLAAAYHAAGRFDEAIFSARRALVSNSPDVRARAYASIGHHQFSAERLPEALEAFRRALLEVPTDESRHDYEVVLRLLYPPEPPPETSTPTPEPGEQPGGSPTQPGAEATPSPGDNGQSGSGTPSPGAGTPGSGTPGAGTPGAGQGNGTPTAGATNQPVTLDQVERQIRDIDRQVTRLIQEAGETPTPSEALEILSLLAERARIAALRDALSGSASPNDY
jgi:Ca-activated chloride channel family protein